MNIKDILIIEADDFSSRVFICCFVECFYLKEIARASVLADMNVTVVFNRFYICHDRFFFKHCQCWIFTLYQ